MRRRRYFSGIGVVCCSGGNQEFCTDCRRSRCTGSCKSANDLGSLGSYNIPATVSSLPQSVKDKDLPPGTLPGLNDWKKTGYGGPCPPIGEHRYFHKLYALDTVLPDLKRPTKAKLEKAMEGHILSEAELIGLYRRK